MKIKFFILFGIIYSASSYGYEMEIECKQQAWEEKQDFVTALQNPNTEEVLDWLNKNKPDISPDFYHLYLDYKSRINIANMNLNAAYNLCLQKKKEDLLNKYK